jgi:hypothetical protein
LSVWTEVATAELLSFVEPTPYCGRNFGKLSGSNARKQPHESSRVKALNCFAISAHSGISDQLLKFSLRWEASAHFRSRKCPGAT